MSTVSESNSPSGIVVALGQVGGKFLAFRSPPPLGSIPSARCTDPLKDGSHLNQLYDEKGPDGVTLRNRIISIVDEIAPMWCLVGPFGIRGDHIDKGYDNCAWVVRVFQGSLSVERAVELIRRCHRVLTEFHLDCAIQVDEGAPQLLWQ